MKKRSNTKAASPARRSKKNAGPYNGNAMLNGVFENGLYGTMPLSQPFEMANNNSYNPVTLNRILLTYAYMTYGIVQTVINQPVDDGMRGGILIQSDELSPDDLKLLQKYLGKFVYKPLKSALKWAELYGGAGLVINTDQDPKSKLVDTSIDQDSPLVFIPADRWELNLTYANVETAECPYDFYGQSIHRSRVIRVTGVEAPSFLKQRLQGWELSKIENLVRPLNSYLKNEDVIYEMLDEAKIDVWQMKGFNTQILTGAAQGKTAQRLTIANMLKNYHRALIMDAEDKYEQKQVTFGGLGEMLEQNRIGIACNARIPMAKLFGLSAAGFNSGEDDLENYNAMVESDVRSKARDAFERILPLVCQQLFGFVPEHLEFEFQPLRVMTEEQTENVKTMKFNRVSAMYAQGMFAGEQPGKYYAEELKKQEIIALDSPAAKGECDPEPPAAPNLTIDIPQMPVKAKAPKEGM